MLANITFSGLNLNQFYKCDWKSFHIYFDSNQDDFLKDYLNNFIKNNSAFFEKFFFIRYYESGLHLRVRFFKLVNIKVIYDFLNGIDIYFDKKGLGDTYKILITNYIPEIDRYGGKEYIQICETIFYISSLLSLEFISKNSSRNFIEKVVDALTLNVLLRTIFFNKANLGYIIDSNLHSNENLKEPIDVQFNDVLISIKKRASIIENEIIPSTLLFYDRFNELFIKLSSDNTINRVLPSLLHMNHNRIGIENQNELTILKLLIDKSINEEYNRIIGLNCVKNN